MPKIGDPKSVLIAEPNLLIPGKHPVGSVIVSKDQIASGLALSIVAQGSSGIIDIAQRKPLAFTSGVTREVELIVFNGTSGYITAGTGELLSGAEITIIAELKNSTGTLTSFMSCAVDTNPGSSRINVHLPYSGTVYFDYGRISAGGRLSVATSVSTTAFTKWAFVAAPSYMAIWKNKSIIASQASGDSVAFSSTGNIEIGAFSAASLYYPGRMKYIHIFKRRLSTGEINKIMDDPMCVYEPA